MVSYYSSIVTLSVRCTIFRGTITSRPIGCSEWCHDRKIELPLHLSKTACEYLKVPGSWFILCQRCIGWHDSSSSSCPPQPLQPRPSWCPSFLTTSFQFCCPPPETFGFRCESLSRKSMVIHSWKMSKPSQTSASDNVFQLWKYFVLPGNAQCTSLPSVVRCFEFFHLCDWD